MDNIINYTGCIFLIVAGVTLIIFGIVGLFK